MSNSINTKNIAIVGAGIGGLVTALALKKKGVIATVYESASSISPVGAGIILSINAMRILKSLGVADEVIAAGHIVKTVSIANGKGQVISQNDLQPISKRFDCPSVAIHRFKLHQILLKPLSEGQLILDSRCSALNLKHNKMTLMNGQEIVFDLLIGSDGFSSTIREQLGINSIIRDAGQICYRGVVSVPQSVNITHDFQEKWANGKRFGFTILGNKELYWYATFNKKVYSAVAKQDVKSTLLDEFSGWHNEVSDILCAQDNDLILQHDLLDKRPSKCWSKENVVLVGDAIHPTTPNLGQGAAMAIESAYVLVECLSSEQDIFDSIKKYQRKRSGRTSMITHQSWNIGLISNWHSYFSCQIRDQFLTMMPDKLLNHKAEKLMSYEP